MHSPGSPTQHSVMAHTGKEPKQETIYVYA